MVRILGIDLKLGRTADSEKDIIEKAFIDQKFASNLRTSMDLLQTQGGDEVRVPYYPLPPRTLYEVAAYSDVLKNVITSLKAEIFRNGIEITERFANKCLNCGKEFEHPVDECDECKEAKKPSANLKEPDVAQRKALKEFIDRCNDNGQTIMDVSASLNDDLEIIDDAYMQLVKEYLFDREGNLVGSTVQEVLRIHPIFIKIVADKTGRPGRDDTGKKVYTCLEHRTVVWKDKENCPVCGKKLFQAYFRGEGTQGQFIYYVKDEVKHMSKYSPSLTFGFSNIFACWMKIITLMNQDNYIKNYYARQRPPRGLLFVRTPNMSSLEKAWNWMLDMFKKNPHMIPPIAIESEGGTGKFVEFIDFMRSLDEMQFTEMRNEFRRQIGALYGIMPIFSADLSTSGGLNNEGLQITVTNRAVQSGQKLFNEGFYPWLLEQLGITDYKLELLPSEEKDEIAKLQVEAQKIQNARMMQGMGYDVTLNEDNEFEFEPTEVPVQQPSFGQGFPGGAQGLRTPNAPNPSQIGGGQSPQRYSGEPESMGKADNPITTMTPSAYHPRYRLRRRNVELMLRKVQEDVSKESGILLDVSKAEEGIPRMADFITQSLYEGKFEGTSKSISDLIKEYIVRAITRGYSIKQVMDYISRKGGREVNAESIARTETQALQNKAREWSYLKVDPEGKLKYKWINPLDNRTTEICRNLVSQTRDGVSIEELKSLVESESRKAGFEPREFTPHIGCRSTFVRTFS